MNIKITKRAKDELDKLIKNQDNKIKYVRLYTRPASLWCDASIAITLDELRENDEEFVVDNYKIIMNKSLASRVSGITISFGGFMSRDSFSVDADFEFDEYWYLSI